MSNAIQLLREGIREGSERLSQVARWASPEDADGYWHIPRSGELADAALQRRYRRSSDEVAILRFWCGQVRWVAMSRLHDEPFPNALRCGTCEGRASGWERKDGLIYSPRSPFDTPKLCPALVRDNEQKCPFCGSKIRWRRNGYHFDQTQHRVGDGLAAATPCPHHGWKYVSRQSAGLVCFGTPWRNDCGFLVMPAVGTERDTP